MTDAGRQYFGKYRGTVVNILDPEFRGRIQALVPDVLGEGLSTWAMPCLPIAGRQMGTHFVPQVGSGVWIEFEQGDPDYPIWSGCFWGNLGEVPALARAGLPLSPSIVLQTTGQNTIVISDVPGPTGGILLKSGLATISVSATGIVIQNGTGASITLTGTSVAINRDGLVVGF